MPGHFRTPPHSMAAQAVAQSAANAQESLTCVKCLVQLVRARASRFAAARLHGADEAPVSTGGAPDRGPPRLVPRRGVQASRDCWPAERHGAEGASRWPVAAPAALLTSPLRNRCGPHFGAHRRNFRRKRARFATGLTEVRLSSAAALRLLASASRCWRGLVTLRLCAVSSAVHAARSWLLAALTFSALTPLARGGAARYAACGNDAYTTCIATLRCAPQVSTTRSRSAA